MFERGKTVTGRIFHLNENGNATPLEEHPYDAEKTLQELLAKHPDLLAGEQIDSTDPRRWLLVTREMAVPDEEDGGGKWSLDHLFLDQDGIPTLVEVKRSTNTGIRRKVVGQMLDYAANAVAYWPVEEIRAKHEARCEAAGIDPEEELSDLLDEDSNAEDFWQQVKTNLQAGRIRMVFVADKIPSELRQIVEFLNEQMDPAEVLALEIKQYIGEGIKTLVPRVLGQTETAKRKKSTSSGEHWDEASFMAALQDRKGEAAREVAEDLLHWITPQVTEVRWGTGAKEGGFSPVIKNSIVKYHLCRVTTKGWFIFRFDWLCKKPPLKDESARSELLSKINEIPDVHFTTDVLTKRARIPLKKLMSEPATEKLKVALAWLISEVNAYCEAESRKQ